MRGEKQESLLRQQVSEWEQGFMSSQNCYSHHEIFEDQAVLTIVKKSESKCKNQHTSEVDLHIYLCEPGRIQEIDRGRLLITKRAKFSAEVKKADGVINVNITASHGNKRKKYSLRYYQ